MADTRGSRLTLPTTILLVAVIFSSLAEQASQAQEPAPGRKYALLVGVRNYDKNELRNLPYTEDDIESLAKVFENAGFRRVVVLTQTRGADQSRFLPLAANIRNSLRGMLEDRQPEDSIVVALAGHGVQFRGDEHSYFCPMDAKLADRKTLIPLDEIFGGLKACEAGLKLLLVDACRNDPQSDHSRARSQVSLESVTRPQSQKPPGGVAAFFSCSEGERAFESPELKHGVFFHYVIEAMGGKADFNKDDSVSIDEVVLYAKSEVPDRVKDEFGDDVRQMPELVGSTRGLAPLVTLARIERPVPPRPQMKAAAPVDNLDEPHAPASHEEIAAALLRLDGKGNGPNTIKVGLILGGPLSKQNVRDLRMLEQRNTVVVEVSCNWQRVKTDAATNDSVSLFDTMPSLKNAGFKLRDDPRYLVDNPSLNVLVIVGTLNTSTPEEEARTIWQPNPPQDSGALLDLLAVYALMSRHDVFVFQDKLDWQPRETRVYDKDMTPQSAMNEFRKICWYAGLKGANDFSAFLESVSSRQQGKGTIRDSLPANPTEPAPMPASQPSGSKPSKGSRDEIVSHYLEALKIKGDATEGKRLVELHCAKCHGATDATKENMVAPKLASSHVNNRLSFVANVFDPNRTVAPKYVKYTVTRSNGDQLEGLLLEDAKEYVKILSEDGTRTTWGRDSIEELISTKKSLMPEIFESVLSNQEVADVMAYLKTQ